MIRLLLVGGAYQCAQREVEGSGQRTTPIVALIPLQSATGATCITLLHGMGHPCGCQHCLH